MKKNTVLTLLAAAGGLFSQTSAQAQTGFGVQFTSGAVRALAPTEAAGKVAITNFNPEGGGSGTNITGLKDSNGGVLTNTTLSFTTNYTNPAFNTPGNPTPDQVLFSGGLATNRQNIPITVSLTNIPYASYNLYAFFGPNNGNGNSFFQYAVTDGTTTFYSNAAGGGFPGYNQATQTTPGNYSDNGTYALFSETTSSLSFSFNPLENGGVDLVGFEIISTAAVPEPSTWIAGAGLLGLVAYHLRRRVQKVA